MQINTMAMLLSEFHFLPIYRADLAGSRTLSFSVSTSVFLNTNDVMDLLKNSQELKM